MLNEKQKRFLQQLLYKPLLSAKELQNVYSVCFGSTGSNLNDIKKLIDELNLHLKLAQLTIKYRLCEDTNDEYFALISVTESQAAKHSVEFTPVELELFKRILKEILSSDNGCISSTECINYSSEISKLSKTDAQKALDKFVSSLWLKQKDGEVSFTVRTLLELEPLLKKVDTDLSDCKICCNLVIKGVTCANCSGKVHRFCLSKISRAISAMKCPSCKQQWPTSLEETFSSQLQLQSQSQSQLNETTSGARKRRIKKRQIESDSD